MTIRLEILELVIVGLLLVGEQTNGSETKRCPSYCTCDLFENFNRADCSGQRLITPNLEVPTAVELLDLSYNDITTLDNVCFEGLIYVVNLTIAHNALHTIYLDAFSPLKEVKSIDLSFNRLEYFDERIFETNTKLTKLDLSGNKFMSLQNKPLLKSASIQYLRLHDAQVSYIYPLMFQEMPALREVDISNNLMITLSTTAFSSLHQLETVNLEQNRWICDKSFDDTLQLLKKRGVETKLSSCAVFGVKKGRSGPHMFERMMEAPPPEAVPKESASVENVWKLKKPSSFGFDEGVTCEQQSPIKICEVHRNCLININALIKEKNEKLAAAMSPRGQYTVNDLCFVFLTGISLGMAMVICFVTCAICIKRCCAMQSKPPHRRPEATRVVNVTSTHRPIPPPIPPRQRRSNRRPGNTSIPPLNRSLSSPARRGPPADGNQGDFATFISRFFERPSRHQYYRTINENTAHMIRRLSQSNLFNNRLSQHFTGARTENVQQTEPLIHIGDILSTSNQPQVHRSTDERRQPPQVNMGTAPPMRPETPPPSYGDVIKPKGLV